MNGRSQPVWVLHLIPSVTYGRTVYAVVCLAALLTLSQQAGVFEPRPTSMTSTAPVLFFAVLLAYIVPALHFIVAHSEAAFDELVPHLDAAVDELGHWRRSIRFRTLPRQLAVAAVGLTAGVVHNILLALPDSMVDVFTASAADAAVVIGTLLVWIFMTAAIFALIDIARLFARLARCVRIDLLQPRALTPFARVAVISTLVLIGAQAAFPIMWLGEDDLSLLASVPGLIATAAPMMFLFAMPLLPIHRAISAAKAAELQRLDAKVAMLGAAARTVEREPQLGELLPLLVYRREIEAVHEWPFDTSVVSRLAVYLVIPPLTWIGAALIEHFVEGAL